MSRIGRLPIPVPSGATVTVKGQTIEAKGPKGAQTLVVSDLITPELNDNELVLKPRADLHKAAEDKIEDIKAKGKKMITYAQALDGSARAQWGTSRARAANMITGVTEGYSKRLELHGVGYRAQMQGKDLKLSLGFSHDVVYKAPEGIEIKCEKPTEILVSGSDKQIVGQVAAEIRKYRKPEPYKGKGVRYEGEYVRRKEGKKK